MSFPGRRHQQPTTFQVATGGWLLGCTQGLIPPLTIVGAWYRTHASWLKSQCRWTRYVCVHDCCTQIHVCEYQISGIWNYNITDMSTFIELNKTISYCSAQNPHIVNELHNTHVYVRLEVHSSSGCYIPACTAQIVHKLFCNDLMTAGLYTVWSHEVVKRLIGAFFGGCPLIWVPLSWLALSSECCIKSI